MLKHSKVEIELLVNCSYVTRLEHVQAKINLTSNKRGDLEIRLLSPAGTVSILLDVRPMDNSRMGFTDWPFMTVHNWGENANGVWKLVVINRGFGNTSKWDFGCTMFMIVDRTNSVYLPPDATLTGWELILHGTGEDTDTNDHQDHTNAAPPTKPHYVAENQSPTKQSSSHDNGKNSFTKEAKTKPFISLDTSA